MKIEADILIRRVSISGKFRVHTINLICK